MILNNFLFSTINDDIRSAELLFKVNNYNGGITILKNLIRNNPTYIENDKIQLLIARNTRVLNESISEYNKFLTEYSNSRFQFIARYELAILLFQNSKYDESYSEFFRLSQLSRGTPYWQKSLLYLGIIELRNNRFINALSIYYRLLENLDDYDDFCKTYFYIGYLYFVQNQYDDAEHFFLISAGSFPSGSMAISSLFYLLKIYSIQNRKLSFNKIYSILTQSYPGSREAIDAIQIKNTFNNALSTEQTAADLIILVDYKDIRNQAMARLISDIDLSLFKFEDQIEQQARYFLQLGFYSDKNNAERFINQIRSSIEINPLIITVQNNNRTFYRVLIGPYQTREIANNNLIQLKEKNIESIILEMD